VNRAQKQTGVLPLQFEHVWGSWTRLAERARTLPPSVPSLPSLPLSSALPLRLRCSSRKASGCLRRRNRWTGRLWGLGRRPRLVPPHVRSSRRLSGAKWDYKGIMNKTNLDLCSDMVYLV
jgi:hypothetical protein